jgi:hypothetical protein
MKLRRDNLKKNEKNKEKKEKNEKESNCSEMVGRVCRYGL